MKSGVSMMGLQFCGWPTGVLSSNIPFTSPLPSLGSGLGLSEGNSNSFLTPNVASSKSESPVPQNEKVSSTQSTAVEVAKPVDFPSPKPIPEEMQFGWWRIIDPEDLKALLKVLHLRGIREKALQKQIQKHLDYITQACIKNKDVAIIELNENEESQVTRDIVENWSVEEQAMEMDLSILQQGWMCPEPASEREDLVYFEHKSFSKLCKEHDGECTGEEESSAHALDRKSDNPLDIAVTRLADLERNIERRYLKSPLSTTIQIKLDNVGTVTVPAPAPSISGDGDGIEEDIAPGLRVWRRALSEARSAAQVALCVQQLQKSIAWEKSIMKVASGQTLKIKKLHVKGKKAESKKGKKVTLTGDTEDEDSASTSSSLKRGIKDLKKRKMEENTSINLSKQESFTSVKKPKRDDSKDVALCRYPNLETFALDVRLVFDNCETFNEDDSDIGRAGHSMRKYFEKKWTDTFKVS
ncbi:Bromodomain adjacent to zinc finger domain protein 2B [Camelus dromedarius]|uniref:Bromodomain adjacent to zinc finger domain protein 2B n=1 Tax=Camelus dromedarius TaxID=9838 RepID=A0A5N4E5X7_CAMDR|nr:Bromodomain adjacent to zinc finger domain protein 2B [Camelus dromedarius]